MSETRNERARMTGTVVSDRMNKTIVVEVARTFRHPKYGKFVRRTKKYQAHDEKEEAGIGDQVELRATRPISKLKRWRLVRVLVVAKSGPEIAADEAKLREVLTGVRAAEPEAPQ